MASDLSVNNLDVSGELLFGSWGTVTQLTSKAAGVTLNTRRGQITMNNASLAAATMASMRVTNSLARVTSVIAVSIVGDSTNPGYWICVGAQANGSFDVVIENRTAGALSEALILNFVII